MAIVEPETAKPLIYESLSAVMGDVTAVGKDSENKSQGFKFRGIDAILNMVAPALREHKVVVLPTVLEKEHEIVSTRSGGTMNHIVIKVRYVFIATDGSWVETTVYGESSDAGDKAISKAMSVALRNALIQCLAIPTGDKDPDETTYERGAPARKEVPLPPDMVALIEGATTLEEMNAVKEAVISADISDDIKHGLGVVWNARYKTLEKTVKKPVVAETISEIRSVRAGMTKPQMLDFLSHVIEAGIPSIEDGYDHLTVEQQAKVLEIAYSIITPKEATA